MREINIIDLPAGDGYGTLGLALTHDPHRAGEYCGSFEGGVDLTCERIRTWGAAAVLSLTEYDVEKAAIPHEHFARGVRERHIAWYNLPIHDRAVPGPAFEEAWKHVGQELRTLLRQGARVVVHGEGDLSRCAMIIGRVMVELGMYYRDAFQHLHEVHPGLVYSRDEVAHVVDTQPLPDRPASDPAHIRDRAVGALLGLAVGDAIGTTLEFKARDSYPHLTDMVGGGPFGLKAGEWTDDTAMALALAETLQDHDRYDDWGHRQALVRGAHFAFDTGGKKNRLARERLRKRGRLAEAGEYEGNQHLFERALMERFTAWMDEGRYSCNGRCFDIGMTVRGALGRWKRDGDPMAGSTDPQSAGNGSLMRLAPVAIRYWNDPGRLKHYAAQQSRTTHGAAEAVDACVAYAQVLAAAIAGELPSQVLAPRETDFVPGIASILAGSWRGKPRHQIRASGYVVHSLEAALWSVGRTTSFAQAVLTAANLGEDADTTAAIAGQLAGALYGASAIPPAWREKLAWHNRIVGYAEALLPQEIRDAR